MSKKLSADIEISAIPEYDYKSSFPSDNRFFFRYHISVTNHGTANIKLLKRRWLIYDVGFGFTEVSGDGVIGMTPEILHDDTFTYFSNVMLRSGIGFMTGFYLFEDLSSGRQFEVEIPRFYLFSEVLSN